MQKINFAIVGCGHIGKRHAEMVLRNEHCNLVAMIDTNTDIHFDLQSKFQVPILTSLEDFHASNIQADILVIATPNGIHHTLAIDALKHNHHVVVEKPMALKSEHCQLMIEVAKQQQKHIFWVMQNR
ncbi:MAG: Gfo/Idh/MocA family oxidoreductase [Bacteroidetes bacterium]|nr:Gfo/Idh/MocA family oxidoreductase [Bacteroidota bacterium]